jgi:tetratricopeptide (TPR) repeat protein/predicted aspartyl protease
MTRCRRALGLAAALGAAAAAHANCSIQQLPDMPVTMEGTVPMVHAQINGNDALFIADSGAFFSMVTPGAAAQFQMSRDPRYDRGEIVGVGGYESAAVVKARSFTLMGFTVPNVDFIVAGVKLHNASGLLGQNVFRLGDVEYDLANGVIRIVRTKDCKNSVLAYWAAAANKPYSVIDIDSATPQAPHTEGVAYLNGTKIHVWFDTGAARSVLTLSAAERAGVTPKSPGVQAAGNEQGIGSRVVPSWIARFASFKLGDEEIAHARLRFADISSVRTDMLIGADFFLSHRVYVATSQRKLYFTYNGGPVFDLEMTREAPEPAVAGAAPAPSDAAQAPTPPPADKRLNEPTDAAGFARRGAASAGRRDYAAALADLTRACELAPTEASYFYQRGVIRWENGQQELALADFDQAIKLKPDDVQSRVARARFKAGRHDPAAATADLEAADQAAARDSDERLRIASVYESLDNFMAARAEFSYWIDNHPHTDSRMADVLNSRCWAGALSGQALNEALADCNAALKIGSSDASYLDSRGLVYLRLGNYDKAIADYDAALKIRPKSVWSLYGRGLARQHKGDSAAGAADLSAASALNPRIAERAAKFGITP